MILLAIVHCVTGEVILPTETPNNAHHDNTGVEHMTQIEIKQSKYGPHRYSTSSDDVDAVLTTYYHGNTVNASGGSTSSEKKATASIKVCCRVCSVILSV